MKTSIKLCLVVLYCGLLVDPSALNLPVAGGPAAAQISSGNSVALLLSTAINANGTGNSVLGLGQYKNLYAVLNLTAVPAGGAPTLDVYLQSSADAGTTWRDLAHTQFTTSAVVRFVAISGDSAGSTSIVAASDGQLAGETVVQGPWGDRLRIKYVFAAGGSSGSYQLAISGIVK
ncbi:MAG TPA: hypothetical protein VN345_13300 [Blastocatellia bacterium]|nr:hypothetical protein [Blastocatellia bacterium]